MLGAELLTDTMAGFGLTFLGYKRSTGIPAFAAGMVTSCHPGDGRIDRTVALDDPERVSKANADWLALAIQHRLMSRERRFLLAIDAFTSIQARFGPEVPDAGELVWGLVELQAVWDIMGAGAESRLLGSGYGYPGFCMSSLDGSVFFQATVWRDFIGTAVLPMPHRVPALREVVRNNIGKPYRSAAENADALAWLSRPQAVS